MAAACDGNARISFFTTLSGRSRVFLQYGHRVRKRSSNAVRSVCARQATQSGCLQQFCLTPRLGHPGMAQRRRRLPAAFLANLYIILDQAACETGGGRFIESVRHVCAPSDAATRSMCHTRNVLEGHMLRTGGTTRAVSCRRTLRVVCCEHSLAAHFAPRSRLLRRPSILLLPFCLASPSSKQSPAEPRARRAAPVMSADIAPGRRWGDKDREARA